MTLPPIPPLLARALAIGSVAALLLVPIGMISGKVSERRARAEAVVAQFAAETMGPQIVAGPLLMLTCEETYADSRVVMRQGRQESVEGTKVRACPDGYIAPRRLAVAADMPVETRHRGLYDVQLYHASLDMSGEFEWPADAPWDGLDQRAWKKAYVVMQVSDARGIRELRSSFPATPRQSNAGWAGPAFAIHEAIGDYGAHRPGDAVAFSYRLRLDGTSSLRIAPVGDSTEIAIRSSWPHPSFTAGTSPDERQVGDDGFSAKWRTTAIATGGSSAWAALARDAFKSSGRAAGVALYQPSNIYTLSYRATEYAFLFILFTFAALALVEALAGVRLHAIQYALVGSAIAVFFLLLLAVSEHAPFTYAYAGAASACSILMTAYLRSPLRSTIRTVAFGALFAGIYTLLYVLLLREDDALLVGSLMVFALLAITMLATRKVDWSAFSARIARETPARPAA